MGYVNEWGMAMGYWSATPLGTSWGMVWNLPQICPTVRVEMLGGVCICQLSFVIS